VGDTHITGRHFGGDTHITSDMCAGIHISRGYTYHCDSGICQSWNLCARSHTSGYPHHRMFTGCHTHNKTTQASVSAVKFFCCFCPPPLLYFSAFKNKPTIHLGLEVPSLSKDLLDERTFLGGKKGLELP